MSQTRITGQKVKTYRKKKDPMQDILAKKANIAYITLTTIKSNAITNPIIQAVIKIASKLGVSVDSLIK